MGISPFQYALCDNVFSQRLIPQSAGLQDYCIFKQLILIQALYSSRHLVTVYSFLTFEMCHYDSIILIQTPANSFIIPKLVFFLGYNKSLLEYNRSMPCMVIKCYNKKVSSQQLSCSDSTAVFVRSLTVSKVDEYNAS